MTGMESIVVGVDMLGHIENIAIKNLALHGLLVSLVDESNGAVAGCELGIVEPIPTTLEFFEELARLLKFFHVAALDILLPPPLDHNDHVRRPADGLHQSFHDLEFHVLGVDQREVYF